MYLEVSCNCNHYTYIIFFSILKIQFGNIDNVTFTKEMWGFDRPCPINPPFEIKPW